ncbi:MAG: hypothetical protein AAF135_03150 [Bacteroidota bacterium]
MSILRIFFYILLAVLGSQLHAQNLTVSAYSRYALGDIIDNTTTRNAGMGGLGVASDNFFSINRANPASYADIVFSTMDIAVFGQPTQVRTDAGENRPVTAGFQNLSFAFPANKGPVIAFGFAPYSTTGYDIFDSRIIELDTTYIQQVDYQGDGGLNQVFLGTAFKTLDKKLRIGFNANYLFGNTLLSWDYTLRNTDSSLVTGITPTSIVRDVYVRGLQGQVGLMYVDTLNKEKRTYIRLGATADYSLNLRADRFTISNEDTVSASDLTRIQLPSKFGFGVMVHQLGHWSVGADFTYQDWNTFQYFNDSTALGPEFRIGLGGEWIPNVESFKYLRRIAYRLGVYMKQTYILVEDEPISDMGVSFGFGLPTGRSGNNRFNRGRSSSRLNLSFELGRRGSLAAGFPVEENYARIRLGINLNERWFVRRVVD